MVTLSPTLLQSMSSAYNSSVVRLRHPETAEAATRILNKFPDLGAAQAAISEDVAPSR